MPFNKNINRFKNDVEFVNYLNNKKYGEINPMIQDLFETLYPNINEEVIIYCKINSNKQKMIFLSK